MYAGSIVRTVAAIDVLLEVVPPFEHENCNIEEDIKNESQSIKSPGTVRFDQHYRALRETTIHRVTGNNVRVHTLPELVSIATLHEAFNSTSR